MVEFAQAPRVSRRRLFLTLSVGSLAIAGLIAALSVLLGEDSWKSIATAGLVFVLNLLVLISFTAAHSWLKIVQRTASVIAVAASLFFLWVDVPYRWEINSGPIPPLVGLRDWALGSWIAVATLSLLCLLSICWKYLRESAPLRLSYILSFIFALGSTAAFWIVAGMDSADPYGNFSFLQLLGSALGILAGTASLIVIVATFVEKARLKGSAGNALRPASESSLRTELQAMAQSGELIELILQNPSTVELLRSKILPVDPGKIDDPKRADSAV